MACDTGVPAVPSTKLAKFLCIPSAPGDRKRSSVNTGARVLTSTECVEMLEEKERKKRQAAELKEKRKVDREERKKKKALEAQERANRKKGTTPICRQFRYYYLQVQSFLARILTLLKRYVKLLPVPFLCVTS